MTPVRCAGDMQAHPVKALHIRQVFIKLSNIHASMPLYCMANFAAQASRRIEDIVNKQRMGHKLRHKQGASVQVPHLLVKGVLLIRLDNKHNYRVSVATDLIVFLYSCRHGEHELFCNIVFREAVERLQTVAKSSGCCQTKCERASSSSEALYTLY